MTATLTSAEITIANLALLRIGNSELIATATDATNQNNVARVLYPYARDYVLNDRPWEFANKRAVLTATTTTALTNWAYVYTYPSDAIKVNRVFSATTATRKDEPIPFQVLNLGTFTAVATNEASAVVEYTKKETDPTLFDQVFTTALTYFLGSEMALALDADPAMAKNALEAYKAIVEKVPQEGLEQAHVTQFLGTATATDVAIANMAFAKLGHMNFLSAFNDHTDEARLASLLYYKARDFVLTDYPWEFAERRAALAGSSTASAATTLWAYSYTYPSDCLRVRSVLGVGSTPDRYEPKPFQVITTGTVTQIHTNEASAAVAYTAKVSDPTLFPPAFVEAVTYYLASELAMPLRVPAEVGKSVIEAYHGIRKNLDAMPKEGLPETTISYVDGTTSTQLVICNKALSRLGYKHLIETMVENTDAARLCSLHYGGAIAATLRSFPWHWATRRGVLTNTVGTYTLATVTNWEYVYGVPTDSAMVRSIVNPFGRTVRHELRVPFELGRSETTGATVLFSNEDEVEILYTSTSVSETNYDPTFKEAVSWYLAAEIAPALGFDPKISMLMRQNFYQVISQAAAQSFNEGNEGPEPDCAFVAARA